MGSGNSSVHSNTRTPIKLPHLPQGATQKMRIYTVTQDTCFQSYFECLLVTASNAGINSGDFKGLREQEAAGGEPVRGEMANLL